MDLVCISASARSIWCHGYVLLFLLNNHLIVFYFAVDYCFLLAGLWFCLVISKCLIVPRINMDISCHLSKMYSLYSTAQFA